MKNLALVLLLISKFMSAQNQNETVLFDYDKFFLTETATSKLDEILQNIEISKIKSVQLFGNTDADGDLKYNVTLSKKRAETVRDYLIAKGISPEKVTVNFDGEKNPITDNKSDFGKQKNRRVDLIFEFNDKEVENIVFQKYKKESQFFTGKSNEEIVIKGKEGTLIRIPKNSLLKPNNKYALGKIQIELKEYYSKSDMILANLHSMSNDEMLETGGMVYIVATNNGEKLKLKKNAKISLEMASKNNLSDMETFYGFQNTNGKTNWDTNPDFEVLNEVFGTVSSIIIFNGNDTIVNIRDVKTKRFQRDTISQRQLNKLDKTILKSAKLGWINCDRFYDVKNKTNLAVSIDLKYKPEIRLIFKDINSIMDGFIDDNNQFVFNNIPVGKKATLLAFSCVENEMYVDMKEIEVTANEPYKMNLVKTSNDDFLLKLNRLNTN